MSSSDSGWDFTMKTNISSASVHGSSNSSMHGNSSFHGNPSFHGSSAHGNHGSHGNFGLHGGSFSRNGFGLSNSMVNISGSQGNSSLYSDEVLRRKISMNSIVTEHKNNNPNSDIRNLNMRSLDNSTHGLARNPGVNMMNGGEPLPGFKKKSKSSKTSREGSREQNVRFPLNFYYSAFCYIVYCFFVFCFLFC